MREEITRILYENSHDDSYCMKIKFENIQKVIDELEGLITSKDKSSIPKPPPSRFISYGEPFCKCGSTRKSKSFFSFERVCRNKECKI